MSYHYNDEIVKSEEEKRMIYEIRKCLGGKYEYYSNGWWNSLTKEQIQAIHRKAIYVKPPKVKNVSKKTTDILVEYPETLEMASRIIFGDDPDLKDVVLLDGDSEEFLTKEELISMYGEDFSEGKKR